MNEIICDRCEQVIGASFCMRNKPELPLGLQNVRLFEKEEN